MNDDLAPFMGLLAVTLARWLDSEKPRKRGTRVVKLHNRHKCRAYYRIAEKPRERGYIID